MPPPPTPSLAAPSPRDVADALLARPRRQVGALPGRSNHIRAGVLVPLVWREDGGLETVLTLRAPALRVHGGEPSWPGGMPEPGDADLSATALREAREEVGAETVQLLGRLSSIPLYTSDHRLVPWVGVVEAHELRPEPSEVAAILRFDVEALLSQPFVHAVAFTLAARTSKSPVWPIRLARTLTGEEARPLPGHVDVVYGGTAHVLMELLEALAPLYGVAVPPLRTGAYTWADLLPDHVPPEPQPDQGEP